MSAARPWFVAAKAAGGAAAIATLCSLGHGLAYAAPAADGSTAGSSTSSISDSSSSDGGSTGSASTEAPSSGDAAAPESGSNSETQSGGQPSTSAPTQPASGVDQATGAGAPEPTTGGETSPSPSSSPTTPATESATPSSQSTASTSTTTPPDDNPARPAITPAIPAPSASEPPSSFSATESHNDTPAESSSSENSAPTPASSESSGDAPTSGVTEDEQPIDAGQTPEPETSALLLLTSALTTGVVYPPGTPYPLPRTNINELLVAYYGYLRQRDPSATFFPSLTTEQIQNQQDTYQYTDSNGQVVQSTAPPTSTPGVSDLLSESDNGSYQYTNLNESPRTVLVFSSTPAEYTIWTQQLEAGDTVNIDAPAPSSYTTIIVYAPRQGNGVVIDDSTTLFTDATGAISSAAHTGPFIDFSNTRPRLLQTTPTIVDTETGSLAGTFGFIDDDGDPTSVQIISGLTATGPNEFTTNSGGHLDYNYVTGAYTYTPTAQARHAAAVAIYQMAQMGYPNYKPTDVVGFVITDPHGASTTDYLQIPIIPDDAAPTLVSTPPTTVDPDTGTVAGTFGFVDPDGDATSVTYSGMTPATANTFTTTTGGTITYDFASGAYTYTPSPAARHAAAQLDAPASAHFDEVQFTITDAAGVQSTQSIALPIAPANEAPYLTAGQPAIIDAISGKTQGSFGFIDPDGDATHVTYAGITPSGPNQFTTASGGILTYDFVTGSYTYTPSTTAREAGLSSDSVTFTITDSTGATSVGALTIPISPLVPYTTTTNDSTGIVTGRIAPPDVNSHDRATYSVTSNPDRNDGTVVVDPNTGEYTFKPSVAALTSAWKSGTPNEASFTVLVQQGPVSKETVVTVPISASKDALVQTLEYAGSAATDVAVGPGGLIYVPDAGSNSLLIVDPSTGQTVGSVWVGDGPTSATVDQQGRVWTTNANDGTISIYSPTGTLDRTIVGRGPIAVTFGNDGFAYVVNSRDGSVSVVNPSLQVQRTVTVGSNPTSATTSADGRVYVSNAGSGTITVIDPAADYATDTITLPAGVTPYRLTSAGSTVVVADIAGSSIWYLTPADQEPTDNVATLSQSSESPSSWPEVITSSGGESYAVKVVHLDSTPSDVASAADGTVYVASSGASAVYVIDTNGNVDTTHLAGHPVSISVGPDGSVYVGNGFDNTVGVLSSSGDDARYIPVRSKTADVTTTASGTIVATDQSGNMQLIGLGAVHQNSSVGTFTTGTTGLTLTVDPNGIIYTEHQPYFALGGTMYGFDPNTTNIVQYAFVPGLLLNGDTSLSDAKTATTADGTIYVASYYLITGQMNDDHSLEFTTVEPHIIARDIAIGSGDTVVVLTNPPGASGGSLAVYNPATKSIAYTIGDDGLTYKSVTAGDDGSFYAISSDGKTITRINGDNLANYQNFSVGSDSNITGVTATDDGRIVYAASGVLTIADSNFETLTTIKAPYPIQSVTMGKDGRIYGWQTYENVIWTVDPENYSLGIAEIPNLAAGTGYAVIRTVVPGGSGVYVLAVGCHFNYCTNQVGEVGPAGEVTIGNNAQSTYAHLQGIAASASLAMQQGRNIFTSDPAKLSLIVTRLTDAYAVLHGADGNPILDAIDIADRISDLGGRLDGIAEGNMGDYMMGLVDVAGIALGVAGVVVGPEAATFVLGAGVFVDVLSEVIDA